MQCSARSKRTGEQCRAPAMAGRTVCYHHGGKSRAGLSSPSLKTGRYSRYLPARLSERYHEALVDPDLLALRDEIALVDARLADLLARVDTGESGASWRAAGKAYAELKEAMASINIGEAQAAMTTLESILTDASSDYAAWAQIETAIERRAKLVKAEQDLLVAKQQVITSEEAMLLVGGLVGIIRAHERDPVILARIQDDVTRLLVARNRAPVGATGDDE